MDFVKFLRDDVFPKYQCRINFIKAKNHYFFDESSRINYLEQFLGDLEKDLLLPKANKKFKFVCYGFSRMDFKEMVMRGVLSRSPSLEEFDNIFHSFYKNIDAVDLLKPHYIKSINGKLGLCPYVKYITYLLNQDFTKQKMSPSDFLAIIDLNFNIAKKDYKNLKNALFHFMDKHAENVVSSLISSDTQLKSDENSSIKKLVDFENSVCQKLSKFLHAEDLPKFYRFFPNIVIKDDGKDIISDADECFLFNFNYSYLLRKSPKILNADSGLKMCYLVNDFINSNLNKDLRSFIIENTDTFSRFSIVFNSKIAKKDIPEILNDIVDIMIESDKIKTPNLELHDQQIYDSLASKLQKRVSSSIIKPIGTLKLDFNIY